MSDIPREPSPPRITESAQGASLVQFHLRHLLLLTLVGSLVAASLGVCTRDLNAEELRQFLPKLVLVVGAALLGLLFAIGLRLRIEHRAGPLLLRLTASRRARVWWSCYAGFLFVFIWIGLITLSGAVVSMQGISPLFPMAGIAFAWGSVTINAISRVYPDGLEFYEGGIVISGGRHWDWQKLDSWQWKQVGQGSARRGLLLKSQRSVIEATAPSDQIEAVERILAKYLASELPKGE